MNDDAGRDPTLSSWVYSTMRSEGLKLSTLTILWDETSPLDIPNASAIDAAIANASANGIAVELDLYPAHSLALTDGARCPRSADPTGCGDTARIQQFGAWAGAVAQRFPSVHLFVVMNECNQPRFLNPQWDASGANQSAAVCGRALAAAYDAIKAVSRSATVYGLGLSPRGNDSPAATSNSSTTPVTFLAALARWFRAFVRTTRRARGIMDGFDFHPYPVPQSLAFAQGYRNPKDATVTNLGRIYQAFYDAFAGTPQRTIGQQPGGGLPVSLDETGIQTAPGAHAAAYTGAEVSATPAGGVTGSYATEDYQSAWYLQMLELVACDPSIRFVDIFHLIDEPDLAGWQSGLYYADEAPKLAAGTVRDWLARTGGACSGPLRPWLPAGSAQPQAAQPASALAASPQRP